MLNSNSDKVSKESRRWACRNCTRVLRWLELLVEWRKRDEVVRVDRYEWELCADLDHSYGWWTESNCRSSVHRRMSWWSRSTDVRCRVADSYARSFSSRQFDDELRFPITLHRRIHRRMFRDEAEAARWKHPSLSKAERLFVRYQIDHLADWHGSDRCSLNTDIRRCIRIRVLVSSCSGTSTSRNWDRIDWHMNSRCKCHSLSMNNLRTARLHHRWIESNKNQCTRNDR